MASQQASPLAGPLASQLAAGQLAGLRVSQQASGWLAGWLASQPAGRLARWQKSVKEAGSIAVPEGVVIVCRKPGCQFCRRPPPPPMSAVAVLGWIDISLIVIDAVPAPLKYPGIPHYAAQTHFL